MQARAAGIDNPSPMIGPARLIRAAFDASDMAALAQEILARSPDGVIDAGAAMDLATILLLMHRTDEALQLQTDILQGQRLFSLRSNPDQARVRVLILVTAGDLMANTPIDFLLNDDDFSLTYLFLCPGEDMPRDLPEHDVLITGIAYSSGAEPLLEAVAAAAEGWARPIVNHPRAVLKTSRHGIADALRGAEGILAPVVALLDRAALSASASRLPDGLNYPVLVRPLDTHAGNDLQKVDRAEDLTRYLDHATTERFYVTQFCDYRGPDGLFRKLRVVLIDGVPFLCHLAIRDHWMIHYLNAGMLEDAEKRMAEAAAMATFDAAFAQRHRAAFAEIHRRIGLDYLILDCAESSDGRLLIFEADTGMVVHDMDPVDLFPYKLPQMRRVFSAFQQAVRGRAETRPA
ncbi:ATP-grasp domain-containing protein [Methylobacterium fujisawaense]|uniref:ATP-grasp domain-containing protein n=1 Tax=Methylobacterium fujisawaense TaxID=107400 RepID=UPI00313E5D9E